MSDLKCTKCGTTASYADASIADLRRTCETTRRVETPDGSRKVTVDAKHNWVDA